MSATPTPLRVLADPTAHHVLPPSLAAKKQSDAELMAPPPPRLKRPRPTQDVVSEQAYTDALGRVIEREYFPDLPKLQQQLEWLNAVESGDTAKIAEIQLRVSQSVLRAKKAYASTPLPPESSALHPGLLPKAAAEVSSSNPLSDVRIPNTFDDAASVVSWSDAVRSRTKRLKADVDDDVTKSADATAVEEAEKITLREFHDRFVSEDNASFESNQAKVLDQKRRAHWWIYEHASADKYKFLLTDGNASRAVKALVDDHNLKGINLLEDRALGGDTHGLVATWKHRPKNSLYFLPDLQVSNDISRATEKQTQLMLTDGSMNTSSLSDVVSLHGMDIVLASGHRIVKDTGGVVAPMQLRRGATRLPASTMDSAAPSRKGADTMNTDLTVNGYDFVFTPQTQRTTDELELQHTSDLLGITRSSGEGSFTMPANTPRDIALEKALETRTSTKRPRIPAVAAGMGQALSTARRPVFAATPTPGITVPAARAPSHSSTASVASGRSSSTRRSTTLGMSPAGRNLARSIAEQRRRAAGSSNELSDTGLRAAYSPFRKS